MLLEAAAYRLNYPELETVAATSGLTEYLVNIYESGHKVLVLGCAKRFPEDYRWLRDDAL